MFDRVEGDGPVDRLGMLGGFRLELRLGGVGQEAFQAGQIHGRMEVLADRFGTQAREIFQIQAGLEEAIEGFNVPSLMPL